jgi:hypothetical protein
VLTVSKLSQLPKESPIWQVLLDQSQREALHDLLLGIATGIPFLAEAAPDAACRSRLAKIEFVAEVMRALPDGTERKNATAELNPLDT